MSKYVRMIIIETGPALFEIECGEEVCRDGCYNISWEILGALHRGNPKFEGEETCRGQIGAAECGRILHYRGSASYRSSPLGPLA